MASNRIWVLVVFSILLPACSTRSSVRGIADKRSGFRTFIPMKGDAAQDGLKPVKPYFRRAEPSEVLRAIERACDGHRSGSSVYDPASGAGYYVNCNPKNRQLLNGYISANPSQQPHSR